MACCFLLSIVRNFRLLVIRQMGFDNSKKSIRTNGSWAVRGLLALERMESLAQSVDLIHEPFDPVSVHRIPGVTINLEM